jgi:hypothetical protein
VLAATRARTLRSGAVSWRFPCLSGQIYLYFCLEVMLHLVLAYTYTLRVLPAPFRVGCTYKIACILA